MMFGNNEIGGWWWMRTGGRVGAMAENYWDERYYNRAEIRQLRSYSSPITRAHASRTMVSASAEVTVSLVCPASCVCHAASGGGLLNM